ncbi:class I SAM-dependent methyltransferase [Draconibacterium sp. IB214405]|uniref:class I SAM-dependent methyltransferase n=1 Tax=Draconibacterium sp. IB214405 TaxID=3097352 RepID=UPI002A166741|nr:class I SAM-dependent methyltransferase [Draconibacterium sp. IB214405]MDX8340945.1 class I SAM-dependent methyltransferase [Draconibacterium sp. IB214405]
MTEIWEQIFNENQTSWGFEPADSAILAMRFFRGQKAREILIPGIGYGRNARIFCDNGMAVTGIEISKTAIDLAKQKNGIDLKIYHGSVTEMPFENKLYDGIFCYALIHLLNFRERQKFLKACYAQLKPGGYMIFTVVSKKASMYGQGKQLSTDRFKLQNGLSVFFYTPDSIQKEYKRYGLVEFSELDEPIKHMENQPPLKCLMVKCKKK